MDLQTIGQRLKECRMKVDPGVVVNSGFSLEARCKTAREHLEALFRSVEEFRVDEEARVLELLRATAALVKGNSPSEKLTEIAKIIQDARATIEDLGKTLHTHLQADWKKSGEPACQGLGILLRAALEFISNKTRFLREHGRSMGLTA